MSRNVKPGVDPERSDYRTLRVERGTCLIHSRLWSHPPQHTECTSSFLHLRPIQAEIKTFITLFEKCKRIYSLKIMKSEFRRREPCNWWKSVVSTDNFSCERRGSLCSGWWIFVAVNVDIVDELLLSHHILLVLPFRNFHIVTHKAVSSSKYNSEKSSSL